MSGRTALAKIEICVYRASGASKEADPIDHCLYMLHRDELARGLAPLAQAPFVYFGAQVPKIGLTRL